MRYVRHCRRCWAFADSHEMQTIKKRRHRAKSNYAANKTFENDSVAAAPLHRHVYTRHLSEKKMAWMKLPGTLFSRKQFLRARYFGIRFLLPYIKQISQYKPNLCTWSNNILLNLAESAICNMHHFLSVVQICWQIVYKQFTVILCLTD